MDFIDKSCLKVTQGHKVNLAGLRWVIVLPKTSEISYCHSNDILSHMIIDFSENSHTFTHTHTCLLLPFFLDNM